MTQNNEKDNIDIGCGFIAISKDVVNNLDMSNCKGYEIEAWLELQLKAKGIPIKRVPVTCDYTHVSTIPRGIKMVLLVSWFMLKEGFRLRLWNRNNYLWWLDKL